MAVPLIITVTPNAGATGGGSIVDIKTNNARLPPPPLETGFVGGDPPETVQVFFGEEQAANVQVVSRGRVLCNPPIHDVGLVDVTIKNIDDNGVAIPGEEFTKVGAYTYRRPSMTANSSSDFLRLVRTFIVDLKRQIIDNVSLTTHTDYDESTEDFLNITEVGEMPALIVVGPDVVENRFFTRNTFRLSDSTGGVQIRRNPYTIDLQFSLIGVAELTRQLLELMHTTIQYFHRNKYLRLLCDPDNPDLGYIQYEVDFIEEGGEPNVTSRLNLSNVRSFSSTVVIRGFDLEDFEGITDDSVIDLTNRITEILVGVDPPLEIPVEVQEPQPIPPFNDDNLPPAPDIGDFEVIIEEKE